MDKLEIRGVELITAKNQSALVDFLMTENGLKTGVLVAINAEKMILAEENPEIATLLAEAEYKYADGISIVKSILRKYPHSRPLTRIAGADLWEALMQRAGKLGVPVFLLGATPEVLAQTAEKLAQWQVNIVGSQDGYFADEQAVIAKIQQSGAKFVSVALGSPKQERFMQKARTVYPDCLYMGVGGTYDVFVGKVKRAPKCWQDVGLEWLYRLLQQPTRWRRQVRLLKYAWYYVTKRL